MLSLAHRVARWVAAAGIVLGWPIATGRPAASAALAPDEIALVVNRRVPEGRALAEFYAQQRHVPDGRIIELDLDPVSAISPAEDMPFEQYEPNVAAPIRAFLEQHGLRKKIKCLVTFWGMPLRIARHVLSPAEQAQLESLRREEKQARAGVAAVVGALEQSASQLDPSFAPSNGTEIPQLEARLNAAANAILRALPKVQDPSARSARYLQVISSAEKLIGSARTRELMTQPLLLAVAPRPPRPADVVKAQAQLVEAKRVIDAGSAPNATAADRQAAHDVARSALGLFGFVTFLSNQAELYKTDETESALDSELALLWWNAYPRTRWIENPLSWRYQTALRQRNMAMSPVVMVTRLDGPSEQIVHQLIVTSLKVEAAGLKGQVVVDARGKPASDPYGQYDQGLRNLAGFLKARTNLTITIDNAEALIPTHSLKDIALYCGWYSLRNYAPPGEFNPGAVGFHVASLELVSLRLPHERGWVRGLLSDGVCATLGPVAEPYLQSFPPADEFFPMLLTGKLTLAEAYWRTSPMASWMQSCIGDPLYTPYRSNPALKPADLPDPMRVAFMEPVNGPPEQPASTGPSTAPTTAPANGANPGAAQGAAPDGR